MEKVKNYGVEFTLEYLRHPTIVDINIDDNIDTVEFSVNNSNPIKRNICLQNVKKQFPNIKTIIIGNDINDIDISNFMFPNVKKVISYNDNFVSNVNMIVARYKSGNILYNTFCKKPEDTVDLNGIVAFNNNCFDGCMSTNIISCKEIEKCHKNAFSHYLASRIGPFKNGTITFGNVLVGIDESSDTVEFPSNISVSGHNSQHKHIIKKAIVHDSKVFSCLKSYDDISIDTLNIDCKENLDFNFFTLMDLKYIEVNDNSNVYSSKDGILYNKSGTSIVHCPTHYYKENVIIPEGVSVIENGAFSSCDTIKSVKLPDSLKFMGESVFHGCRDLKKIDFGHGITSIGYSAFYACHSLEEVTIPKGIHEIGPMAFMNCFNLKSVTMSEDIYFIGENAFHYSGVKTIKIQSEDCVLAKGCINEVNKVYIPKILPRNFFHALLIDTNSVNPMYINDYSEIIEISDGINSMFIPRYISNEGIEEIENIFKFRKFADVISEKGFLASMYNYATTSETKQNLALTIYKYNGDEDMKAYLKRTAFSFAKRLLVEKKDEQKLIEFLSLNLTTPASLNKLLDIAKEESSKKDSGDMSSLIAYILKAIEDAGGSKRTFTL